MVSFPRVSIVMPAYNHGPYVARAIESVLSQDYTEIELIVIDDGSVDDTWEQIKVAERRSSRPFTAIRQANRGVCRTLNRGIGEATGSYIAVLASDDYYLPGKVSAQVAAFEEASAAVALVHTSAFLDYQNAKPLEDLTGSYRPAVGSCYDDVLTQAVRIIAPSVMFRRQAFDAIGGFDETLAAEDVDFFLRLAADGFEFAYVPRPLMVKTVVEGSGGSNLRRLIEVHERILEKQRKRLTPARYQRLRRLMYEHLIILSAGAGDYRLAWDATGTLLREKRSLSPLLALGYWSARSLLLRALPHSIRHSLRLARASVRRAIGIHGSGWRSLVEIGQRADSPVALSGRGSEVAK